MTAALELARFGISVRIIEKMSAPATTSRAITVQPRTLELMELRGKADEFVRSGNFGLGGSVYGGGKRVFRLDFSHIDSRYQYELFISQAETERILLEALMKENVEVERGVEMISFSQDSSGVKAVLRHKNGIIEEVMASYLIDAEGAHSIARNSLGLQFQGKTFDENYALGDLYIDGDLPSSDFHVFSSSHGFMGLFPLNSSRFRMIASNPLSQPSKDTAPSLEELQTIYDQRSHIPARFHNLTWSSWFRINSRMVEHLNVGRVFLGGDTAHIHSPAGGQGMNTGIQDMVNLGWKLAFVLKGQAREKLLDTYEQDRLPVIHDLLTKTDGLTEIIGTENPIIRSLFNHLAPWIVGADVVQQNSTARLSQLSLGYRHSPLSVHHGHGGSLHAGDRIPDFPLQVVRAGGVKENQTLFHLLNPSRFTLFLVGISDASIHAQISEQLAPWHELIEGIQIEAPNSELEYKRFQDYLGSKPAMLLIRPDGYIGFRCEEHFESELAKYCSEWLLPSSK
ncbi:MAG: FAD-dependent monooxygenase [Rhizonema sp. PD37]|nr:FAD-dependent monooxygenase [Rhizonema sp. PD37]